MIFFKKIFSNENKQQNKVENLGRFLFICFFKEIYSWVQTKESVGVREELYSLTILLLA